MKGEDVLVEMQLVVADPENELQAITGSALHVQIVKSLTFQGDVRDADNIERTR